MFLKASSFISSNTFILTLIPLSSLLPDPGPYRFIISRRSVLQHSMNTGISSRIEIITVLRSYDKTKRHLTLLRISFRDLRFCDLYVLWFFLFLLLKMAYVKQEDEQSYSSLELELTPRKSSDIIGTVKTEYVHEEDVNHYSVIRQAPKGIKYIFNGDIKTKLKPLRRVGYMGAVVVLVIVIILLTVLLATIGGEAAGMTLTLVVLFCSSLWAFDSLSQWC